MGENILSSIFLGRILFGKIVVDFDVTNQLLIRYSVFVMLEIKWDYTGTIHQMFLIMRRSMTQSGEKYSTFFSSDLLYLLN
jgi:hypothetical protein